MPDYQQTDQSTESVLKTIMIIHFALLAGQILFGLVAFSQSMQTRIYIKYSADPFVYIAPMVAIAAYAASTILYKQRINALVNKDTLKEKLTGYQEASIIRFALLEGASLFGIVLYMLNENLLFLVISALIMISFILIRPTRDKMAFDLDLTLPDEL